MQANTSGLHRFILTSYTAPGGGELVLQSKPDLLNGADLNLNSYVSHTFRVKEMPGKISQKCTGENEECMAGTFTVNSHENQGELLLNLSLHCDQKSNSYSTCTYSYVYDSHFHSPWYRD